MKDFEKAFIQYASKQIKAVNAKLIIAKAREIYPNYKDISLNGEMKDENGEIVKFVYVLGGKVRAIRNGEPVLTISDFKTYEIWHFAFFGQGYYNYAKVECESSGISVEVFNDSDSKIKRKKYFVKNEEIDAAKFDRTNCNKYSNFAYLMKILYDKGKTEYQKVQDKQPTEKKPYEKINNIGILYSSLEKVQKIAQGFNKREIELLVHKLPQKPLKGIEEDERELEFENLVELFSGENEDNYPLAEAMAVNYADLFKSKYNLDVQYVSAFKHFFKKTYQVLKIGSLRLRVLASEILKTTKKEWSESLKKKVAKPYTNKHYINLYSKKNYFEAEYYNYNHYYQYNHLYFEYDGIIREYFYEKILNMDTFGLPRPTINSHKQLYDFFVLNYLECNNFDAKNAVINAVYKVLLGLRNHIPTDFPPTDFINFQKNIKDFLEKHPLGSPIPETPFKFNLNRIFFERNSVEMISKQLDFEQDKTFIIQRDDNELIINIFEIKNITKNKKRNKKNNYDYLVNAVLIEDLKLETRFRRLHIWQTNDDSKLEFVTQEQYETALAQEKEFEKETTTYTSLMQVVLAKSLNDVGKIAPNAQEVKSFQKHITENYAEYQR